MERFRQLEELTLLDDYMFGTVMQDPYGRNRCVYHFENRCIEDPALAFGDDTVKVIVNTKGKQDGVSDELREIIRYLDDGTVSGAYSRELEDAVNHIYSIKINLTIGTPSVSRFAAASSLREGAFKLRKTLRFLF